MRKLTIVFSDGQKLDIMAKSYRVQPGGEVAEISLSDGELILNFRQVRYMGFAADDIGSADNAPKANRKK